MVKCVAPRNGEIPRVIRLPWPEASDTVDIAAWTAFVSVASYSHGALGPTSWFQLKVIRIFTWIGGADDQRRPVAYDLVDNDLGLFSILLGSFRTLPPHFAGRNVDVKTRDLNRAHMHWFEEKPNESRLKGEVFDCGSPHL